MKNKIYVNVSNYSYNGLDGFTLNLSDITNKLIKRKKYSMV